MKQLSINSPTAAWIFLLLFALLFWGICMNTPPMSDDYWLNFVIEKSADGSRHYTPKLISSWNDLFTSWVTRRDIIMNGRLSDVFCAITMRVGGIPLFAILNTLILVANTYLLSQLCIRRFNLLSVTVCIAGFILLMPQLDGTVFWKAGSCNYFWPTLPLCVFLLCQENVMKEGNHVSRSIVVTGALAGFLCGAFHEGLGVPMVGGLGAFWFFERLKGKKLPVAYGWLLAFTALGTLITVTAPSVWMRAVQAHPQPQEGLSFRQLILSCFYILHYAGIYLIVLAVLIGKRCIKWHSPMGWILMGLSGFTLCVSFLENGWGGAFYYMGLFVLIFLLKAIGPWCERHSRKVICYLVLLIGMSMAYQYIFMKEMGNIYHNTISAPKENGVCTIDWPGDQKRGIPWVLSRALPLRKDAYTYYYCGKLSGQEDFWVYFRHTKMDSRYFAAFEGLDDTEPHLRLYNGRYLVRLPKGTRLHSFPNAFKDNGKGMNIRQRNTGNSVFLTRMRALFQNRELAFFDEDYHNGFIYLLLPEGISAYQRIELEYDADIPVGSIVLPKPAPVKVTFPLP